MDIVLLTGFGGVMHEAASGTDEVEEMRYTLEPCAAGHWPAEAISHACSHFLMTR